MPPKKGSPEKGKKGSPDKSKTSPDKSSPDKKSSPKKEKGSPDKKGSPKKGKKEVEEPPPEPQRKLNKMTTTSPDIEPHIFTQFRCTRCVLVYRSLQQFINHYCWKSFYLEKFHLGETQAYLCQTCDRVYKYEDDYATHPCVKPVAEDILPITYRNHFKYYINWERRTKFESEYYDTDWPHFCKCMKCGNRFKSAIAYLVHSCFLYSIMKPEVVKNLCLCNVCKYVMLNEEQFDAHVKYCKKPEKAYVRFFDVDLFQRACHQFVIGRHCYEYNMNRKKLDDPEPERYLKIPVGCFACGLLIENITEFLYHPCMAGKLITPTDIELTLLCNDCRCLFITVEMCMNHMQSCPASMFTFVRYTYSELQIALERWTVDIHVNTLLPKRPKQLMCNKCYEIFRELQDLLMHMCSRRIAPIPCYMQPIGLQEMYTCETCFTVLFNSNEAIQHTEVCPLRPKSLMIQIHPTLEECQAALRVWVKQPRLLQLDLSLGLLEPNEEMGG